MMNAFGEAKMLVETGCLVILGINKQDSHTGNFTDFQRLPRREAKKRTAVSPPLVLKRNSQPANTYGRHWISRKVLQIVGA